MSQVDDIDIGDVSVENPVLDTEVPVDQGQDISLSPLRKEVEQIQETQESLNIISDSNFLNFMKLVENAIKEVLVTDQDGLLVFQDTLQMVRSMTKQLSASYAITWATTLSQLSTAINRRQSALMPTPMVVDKVEVSTVSTQQEQEIVQDDSILSSFMQYRSSLDHIRRTSTLTAQQKALYNAFKTQGLIERSVRSQHPTWPLQKIFIQNIRRKSQLTQDQCNYLMEKISVQVEDSHTRKIPHFNPDFHFESTIFQLENTFPEWRNFTDVHRRSQIALPDNVNLSEILVKAKFAFQQQCRWIQLSINPLFNADLNERVAFMLANNRPIKKNCGKCARSFLSRDGHSGVFDGENIYFFIDDVEIFMQVYSRLCNDISPILVDEQYKVRIIAPSIPHHPSLPMDMPNLPPPIEYEALLPLSSSWHSLLKSQLTPELQQRFSPVIGFGSVYIPAFSDKRYGVQGKFIQRMAKFQYNTYEPDTLYNWCIRKGIWEVRPDIVESLPLEHLDYMSYDPPAEDVQQQYHNTHKFFTTQTFDVVRPRQYGSNHFWSLYNRNEPHSQITKVPHTVFGSFTQGHNPFIPSLINDEKADKILFAHSKISGAQKDMVFQSFIDREVQVSTELAIKYRRYQTIQGFNSPFLTWSKPSSFTIQNRLPNVLEFPFLSVPQTTTDFMRTASIRPFAWIPKSIAPHYDDETDVYYSSKKALLELKNKRMRSMQPNTLPNIRQVDAAQQQRPIKYQKTNNKFNKK